MKKNSPVFLIISLAVMMVLGTTSCKRGAATDPTVTGPAGFRMSLSGTANPSTLYVPQTSPSASTLIAVRALKNDGTPAVGYTIVFEDYLGYGYFEGFKVSDTRVTDSYGRAQINYFIPPASNIRSTIVGQIKATLVDNGRLDNLPLSDVWDVIPLRVIPYMNQGLIIHGNVLTPGGSGVGNVSITLVGDVGQSSAVTVTRPSGSYEFLVNGGWYGVITAVAPGYTFNPSNYTFTIENAITTNIDHIDFIANFSGGNVLAADVSTWEIPAQGGTTSVNVTNSSGDESIGYTVVPNVPWLHASPGAGNTPGSFSLVADENTSGSERTGMVVITATSSQASSVTITVTQLGYDVPGGSVLAADVTSIFDTGAGRTVKINVYNSGTVSNPIEYIITPHATWLIPSKTSGTTNDSFDLLISPSTVGDRTSTVTLTPTSTGVTNIVTITVTQSGGATIAVSPTTYSAPSTGSHTFTVTVTNPNSSDVLTWTADSAATWIGISPTSGTTASASVIITVQTANPGSTPRQALITFTGSNGTTATVLVTQAGS